MEVTVPITPRRTRALRPLLPPGPGGVDNVSSRGDRYGRHRLCSTRILIALRSDCHQGKRQIDRDFSRGRARRRPAGYPVLGRCCRARCEVCATIWRGSIRAATRAAPTVRVATTSAISRRSTVNTTRVCVPKARSLAWERGMGRGPSARIPGSRAWRRGCGPAARDPGRRPTPCLVPTSAPGDRRVARSHGFYDQKGGGDGCRRGRPAQTPAHPIAVAKSPMRYASRNRAPSGRSHEFLTCCNHMRT